MNTLPERYFIVGGAGFIGSHFTDHLLGLAETEKVTLYDNLSSGRTWHFERHLADPRFRFVKGEVTDLASLRDAMDGHAVVIHLASNPDIARAAKEPTIDFDQGTALTQNVVEAMRTTSARRILYASGSGVYGDIGTTEAREDMGPMVPVSTYGASKLAGEVLVSAYSYMFDCSGCAFRFGNVVGPRQTHGVGFDFLRKLLKDPNKLTILGNGTQSKSYIHVTDVVQAVLTAHRKTTLPFQAYNVATGDYITVREIAGLAVECLGLDPAKVELDFLGGDRGWKGDVPIIRLNTDLIQTTGWKCRKSTREALRDSLMAMIADGKAGKLWES